jgi:uncharacterized protein
MAIPKPSGQSEPAFRSLRQVMSEHPLFSYFSMAYAFSWIMMIPCILAEWGYLPAVISNIFFVVKAFAGPFLAGCIMINITEGKEGMGRFWRRFFQVRAGWQWYLFILLGIPAMYLLGIISQPGTSASFHGFPHNSPVYYLIYYLVTFVITFFFGGPLAEEPGWRGFALPRLLRRYGALQGTLLLGIVWAFWHLPDFLTHAQGGGPHTGWGAFFTNLPLFVLIVIGISIVMTWVFNYTQGSLFIAMLLHASINTTGVLPELFPNPNIPVMTMADLAMLIAVVIPALLIVIQTRGQLGYQPVQDQSLK